jgi:holin-like protein
MQRSANALIHINVMLFRRPESRDGEEGTRRILPADSSSGQDGQSKMIGAITLLLVFQLLGEVLAQGFALPVPGPVIGMALLFVTLAWRGGPEPELRTTAQSLLQHLSLLFVPAGTGVMLHFQRMSDEWLPLLVSLLVSTTLTIALTALALRLLLRTGSRSKEDA